MKRLITSIKNIWKIDELRQRILFTLLLLAVYRLGSYVVLPGINSEVLSQMFQQTQGTGILGLLNGFVGGAFARGSILALGIMPYISASIIIQLMTAAVPSIQKLAKEGDSGQKKINQLTRYLTVAITAAQSVGYIINLQGQYSPAITAPGSTFWLTSIFILTAGTLFLVWLGERITENGIGNGISLLIAIGIMADLPMALVNEFNASPLMIFFFELVVLGFVTAVVILLTTGTRKIPVNYAKRMVGNRMMGGMTTNVRQYIPLKINASGVMPIIFAQAIMFLPAMIAQYFQESDFWTSTGTAFSDHYGLAYNLVFVTLIIVFTYFYTAIAVNPNDIADQLKRNNGFIPGIKPGKATADFIDRTLTRITLPGSIFLAFVAIIPTLAAQFGVGTQFSNFFGGTSLLIMIGVVLDTLQQIESYLLNRHYDGLMKSGRIKGRSQQVGAAI
jgi:preprotein translocase subunit SecY